VTNEHFADDVTVEFESLCNDQKIESTLEIGVGNSLYDLRDSSSRKPPV